MKPGKRRPAGRLISPSRLPKRELLKRLRKAIRQPPALRDHTQEEP